MSTDEFLSKLRQGDYSLILEWVIFLEEHYSISVDNSTADNIISLMTYELINNGFSYDDVKHIQLLNAVLNSSGFAVPGRLECAIMHLISAVLQYQVYYKYALLSFYQSPNTLDFFAIQKWMATDNFLLSERANSDALQVTSDALQATIPVLQIEAEKIKDKILTVVYYQNCCNEYLNTLRKIDSADNTLAMRTELVHDLYHYLLSQLVINSRLTEKIKSFLDKIRMLAPFEWEEDYLAIFAEQSMVHWIHQEATRRFHFFSKQVFEYLTPPPVIEEAVGELASGIPSMNDPD